MSVVGRRSYLEVTHLVVVRNPTSHQNTHPKVTHFQHVVAKAEVRGVGVGPDGSLGVLGEGGDAGVRAELGG